MTEIEQYIASNGSEGVASYLRAEPRFAALNMLWHTPSHILPMCSHFGLQSLADAEWFAATLMDGSAWVSRREDLAAWISPRPGVEPAAVRKVNWLTIEPVLAHGVPRADPYWVQPNDSTVWTPTVDQLRAMMRSCPAQRYPWRMNDNDCDDHTRILRGWLAQHGLGPAAIGFAGYLVYDAAGEMIGAHALGLAICWEPATGKYVPWLAEPRDGTVHPITTATLGGFTRGVRIAFLRAIF